MCGIGEPDSSGKAINSEERIIVAKATINRPIMTGKMNLQNRFFSVNFSVSVNLITVLTITFGHADKFNP